MLFWVFIKFETAPVLFTVFAFTGAVPCNFDKIGTGADFSKINVCRERDIRYQPTQIGTGA